MKILNKGEKIMKVKIIKNAPSSSTASDISKYIGKIFTVEDDRVYDDGSIGVDFGDESRSAKVYKGEYEIIEDINKELLKFVSKNCPEDVYYQDILDFILKHRLVLVDLLQ